MIDVITDITALSYFRMPPQYRAMCPPICTGAHDACRKELRRNPTSAEIGLPFHVLVGDRGARTNSVNIKQHLFLEEMLPGWTYETELGFEATSPLLTAFILSRRVSDLELLLVLSEMLGSFAAYRPSEGIESALCGAIESKQMPAHIGWERFPSDGFMPSNLWKREPLVTEEELIEFCKDIKDYRGARRFTKIAGAVPCGVASPFEAETALLMSLPRDRGGAGFAHVAYNVQIKLSSEARAIAGKDRVYIDILLVSDDGTRQVAIECQGRATHGAQGAGLKDAARMTALQSMGYRVFLITHDQIKDAAQFETIVKAVCFELGMKYAKRTSNETDSTELLRRRLFLNWTDLGVKRENFERDKRLNMLWRL